jgi:hypothetical protein
VSGLGQPVAAGRYRLCVCVLELPQAVVAVQVQQRAADRLFGQDALAPTIIQRVRRRAVPDNLDRVPCPVAIVGEARGQSEHPGLGHSPHAVVGELMHGQGHSRYPLGQQLIPVGPGVGFVLRLCPKGVGAPVASHLVGEAIGEGRSAKYCLIVEGNQLIRVARLDFYRMLCYVSVWFAPSHQRS